MKISLDGVPLDKHSEIKDFISSIVNMYNEKSLHTEDIEIIIPKDYCEFRKNHGYPCAGNGTSHGKAIYEKGIVILNNVKFCNGIDRVSNSQSIILFHELTHMLIRQKTGSYYTKFEEQGLELYFVIWDEYYTVRETTRHFGVFGEHEVNEYFAYLINSLTRLNENLCLIDNLEIDNKLKEDTMQLYIGELGYYLGTCLGIIDGSYFYNKEDFNGYKKDFDQNLVNINYNDVWMKLRSIQDIPSFDDINEIKLLFQNMITLTLQGQLEE